MFALEPIPRGTSRWWRLAPRCTNPACKGRTFLSSFKRRYSGINLAEEWYCGPECFEAAAATKIRDLSAAQGKAITRQGARIPLGLLLLSRGILTTEQIRLVLNRQRETAENFGDAAQELGFATPDQVTSAVAAQWACPVFPLGERQPAIPVRIPRRVLELYRMLPVHFAEKERRLLIGFVNSVHHQILYTIEHMTSCVVAPCFITGQEFERTLRATAPADPRDSELLFDQVMDAAEMAQITRNYAVQLGSARTRLGRCRDYLWARIWGREREMDLLFRLAAS